MNLDTEVTVVRHVISRILVCPYSFKNYSVVKDGCMPNLVGPIRFIKEDNTGVYARIPWEINGRYKTNLMEVEIKLQVDSIEKSARAVVTLIDADLNAIETFYVESDKFINMYYDRLTDFAYAIVNDLNRAINLHVPLEGVKSS